MLNAEDILCYIYIFLIFERERACVRAQAGVGTEGEGEADSPLSREPDTGLDPGTLRSRPGPKADV